MSKNPKKPQNYFCETCHFSTSNKKDYTRHLTTRKHLILYQGDDLEIEKPQKTQKNPTPYECECGRYYSVSGSLWRHKKTCNYVPKNTLEPKDDTSKMNTDVVMEIMKQNKDIQNLLIEQNNKLMEKITEMSVVQNNTINNSNNNNNSNNSFNLNFFLNEQCKNAVNLVDFIDSLQVGVKDLERTGKLGYVEGISQIFLNGLKELDVYNRPIHCTDLKRETVYVRDQDKWEKENEDKSMLHQAVKKITVKNLKQLSEWEKENPEFSDLESKKNDEYMEISKSSLGGYDSEEDKKYKESIIRNVLKHTKVPPKEEVKVDTIQ